MPKGNEEKEVRSIEEIMADPALTEEEWKKELTEAYKKQHLEDSKLYQKYEKQESELRKELTDATLAGTSPEELKSLVEKLEKTTEKKKKEEKRIDETVADLVLEELENHGEFAPPKKEVPQKEEPAIEEPEKTEQLQQEEPVMQEQQIQQNAPQEELTEEELQQLREQAHQRTEKLLNDREMSDDRWMKELHEAIEQEYLLQNKEEFEAQNKKTKDLTDRIEKRNKDGVNTDEEKKELEELEKELGEHLDEVAKGHSRVASQVEYMYQNELEKRQAALEKEQRDMLKKGKDDQTPEGKAIQDSIDTMKKESKRAGEYADQLSAEAQEPKPNIFESTFMKAFSGWLPETLFGMIGSAYGRQGLRAVRVPIDGPGSDASKLFDSEYAVKASGPDSILGIFKGTEKAKEKASDEILQTDRNADLNFDSVDQAAQEQAQKVTQAQQEVEQTAEQKKGYKADSLKMDQGAKMSIKNGQFTIESLRDLPHAEVDAPQQEGPKQDAPKQEAPKQEAAKQDPPKKGKLQIDPGIRYSVKDGQFHVESLKEVPHADVPEQKEPETKEPEKKEEPKKEEPAKEEPAKEELTNVQKAFKISSLFESMLGHDSKYHINSAKYNSMKDAMGKVHDMLGENFGNEFGSLMRDFGNIKSFQDLCKKGGPLDLAIGQALDEVGKKCEAYVNEKTGNLTRNHMGSGMGNARLKDALDGLSIVNPDRAKEMGKHIDIDVVDGKASKRMNYNELNKMEREAELKEMDEKKKARKEIVGAKKKESEMKDRVLMSQEEKSKKQGLHL